MLLSEDLDRLFEQLKTQYDYIIIDSVPAMAVADAVITNRLADVCLYVVREGVLDRRQLPDIEMMYRENKLANMCIVLNGATFSKRGYGYGYGYGYGMNDEHSNEHKGLLARLKRRIRRHKRKHNQYYS